MNLTLFLTTTRPGKDPPSPILPCVEMISASIGRAGATPSSSSSAVQTFPVSLYLMLQDAEAKNFTHVVSWVSDGQAFKIFDQEAFINTIAPNYFRLQKYKSFLRNL